MPEPAAAVFAPVTVVVIAVPVVPPKIADQRVGHPVARFTWKARRAGGEGELLTRRASVCTLATMPAFLNAVAACVSPLPALWIAALTAAARRADVGHADGFTVTFTLLASEKPAPEKYMSREAGAAVVLLRVRQDLSDG